jgi:hypothetical protein
MCARKRAAASIRKSISCGRHDKDNPRTFELAAFSVPRFLRVSLSLCFVFIVCLFAALHLRRPASLIGSKQRQSRPMELFPYSTVRFLRILRLIA